MSTDPPELIQALAGALRMARGVYPTPEEEACALLARLRHDGWAVEPQHEMADLRRQIVELRSAIDALMQPAPSELLAKNLAHPSRRS